MPKFNKFLLLMMLMLSAMTAAVSQTSMQAPQPPLQPPLQTGTASLSGQVRLGGKGFAGGVVSLIPVGRQGNQPPGPQASARQAVTDAEGRFQINNISAGSFRVTVTAPGFVMAGNQQTLQIGEGQAVKDLDLSLAKGGVITGRVTGNGTRPVIEEPVTLTPVDAEGKPAQVRLPPGAMNFRTDDRGVYRIFGLPAGRYQLSVGRGEGQGPRGGGGNRWQRTYYPEALEPAGASILVVEEGQELTGIDVNITSRNTYAIEGRVIDAETGSPIPGVLIGHTKTASPRGNRPNQQAVIEEATDASSNESGEFRIEGLTSGKFRVSAVRDRATGASEYYSEPVPVEISSSDVSGIEIKLLRGATITGSVVLDNPGDPNLQANLQNLMVRATSRADNQSTTGGRGGGGGGRLSTDASAQPGPNGVFRLTGLSPGLVTLTLVDRGARGGSSGLTILRIERDGADMQSGLRVEAGEQVGRVRLVAAYGNSSVRGLVRVEGGVLPPQMRLTVSARRVDAGASVNDRSNRNAQVDGSGRFQIDQLVAGTYELRLQGPGIGRNTINPQNVTLGSGAVQNVILPLNLADLSAQPPRGNPRRPQGTRP